MDFDIVRIDEVSGPKAQIYSIIYEGEEQSLFDCFFEENIDNHYEELEEIAAKLTTMGKETGCRATFFTQYEGAPGDGVVALKCEQMRLYCLRYDNTCIFVGSGGYKPPNVRAYQEHKPLDEKAQEMKRIAACINKAIRDKDLKIMDDGTLDISEFIELKI